MFITRQGGSLDQRHVQRILIRLAAKAGLVGVRVGPHVLRHIGATLLARAIDPFTLQQLLGHASITTTQIYVHLAGTALQQAHIRNSSVDRLTQGRTYLSA